jgi:Putative prokaryotic signal transducing protein/zinc-ribbon domain
MTVGAEDEALVCPTCGRRHPSGERFCASCGMPLVHAVDPRGATEKPGERRERARKIKPQYGEGRLVKVAQAKNQVEAEFIAGLLLEEGIPSVLSSPIAGYAPVIGSRAVLVPESGVQAAREALRAPEREGA